MQSDRDKAIHASMDNSSGSNIPHSHSGEFALPKNEGGHRINRLFNFSKDRKLKAQKKKAEQDLRNKAIKEQQERADVENRETARLQSGGKLNSEIDSLTSENILPKGFRNEKDKAQKFIVQQEIAKKRKRAEEVEMELMQLRRDVQNPHKATKKFEVEEKEQKLGKERVQLAHELQGLNRLFGIADTRKGLFGTFSGNKESKTLPQGILKAQLAQKERDFERFRQPSKLFPGGTLKKRLEKNPDTGETELTSKLSPTIRKRFEDEGLQNRFIGFDDFGQRMFVHAPTKENIATPDDTDAEPEPEDRSANQVLSDILANPRGT